MPKYVVGTDNNYYRPEAPLDFRPDFIVTAESPYSRPTLIEPFDPNNSWQVETARWIEEDTRDKFSLWQIWTNKTIVTNLDGTVII